ncbi:hypothetical protein EON66_03560 [archaeon]|nr:MAG: hypothetical protein EON66_03560 [archaeon]
MWISPGRPLPPRIDTSTTFSHVICRIGCPGDAQCTGIAVHVAMCLLAPLSTSSVTVWAQEWHEVCGGAVSAAIP